MTQHLSATRLLIAMQVHAFATIFNVFKSTTNDLCLFYNICFHILKDCLLISIEFIIKSQIFYPLLISL